MQRYRLYLCKVLNFFAEFAVSPIEIFTPSGYRVWQTEDSHTSMRPVPARTRVARHRLPVTQAWLSHRPFALFETDPGDAGLLLLDSGTTVLPSRTPLLSLFFP